MSRFVIVAAVEVTDNGITSVLRLTGGHQDHVIWRSPAEEAYTGDKGIAQRLRLHERAENKLVNALSALLRS
jgi:hypothetical protein